MAKDTGIRETRIKEFPKYEDNPALHGLVIPVRDKKLTVATGESWSNDHADYVPTVAAKITCDTEQFIKLYTADIAQWFNLSQTGFRLFGALMLAIQNEAIAKDKILFSHTGKTCKTFKISKDVYYRGITELLQKGFIFRTTDGTNIYFYNPHLFFNGDRVRFIREYNRTDAEPLSPELAPRFIEQQTRRRKNKKHQIDDQPTVNLKMHEDNYNPGILEAAAEIERGDGICFDPRGKTLEEIEVGLQCR